MKNKIEDPVETEINGVSVDVDELWDTFYSIGGEGSLHHGGEKFAIYISEGMSIFPCGEMSENGHNCDICDEISDTISKKSKRQKHGYNHF